jgi:DNA-binding beta-propeller fold protein YncE
MLRIAHPLLALFALLMVFTLFPTSLLVPAVVNAQDSINELVTLPGSCVRGLPTGSSEPACCLKGFVILDGEVVDGAEVTVTLADGTLLNDRSRIDSNYPEQPYYEMAINRPVGEVVSITASYAGYRHTISHQLLSGPQRVDVVLPRNQESRFTFVNQIKHQVPQLQIFSPRDIATDQAGSFFLTDAVTAKIVVLNREGIVLREWGGFGSGYGEFASIRGVTVDRQGFVYVVDDGNARIQKFTSTGDFILSWMIDEAVEDSTRIINDIVVDSSGFVYVSTHHPNRPSRILKYTTSGFFVTSWGGNGILPGMFDASVWWDMAVDNEGHLYVADGRNLRVQKFTTDGVFLTSWGSAGTNDGQFYSYIAELTVDAAGNVYVVDSIRPIGMSLRVQKFSSSGVFLEKFTSADLVGSYAIGITIDNENNLYILGPRIVRLDVTGQITASWPYYDLNTRKPISSRGVAFDHDGNIYVANVSANFVQKFDQQGNLLLTFGRPGSGSGEFSVPNGLVIDDQGIIFVADGGNNRVQKFLADGTWIGTIGRGGDAPGELDFPWGLALDSQGNLYVADDDDMHHITKYDRNGNFILEWPIPSDGYIGMGNIATSIAVGLDDTLYAVRAPLHDVLRFNSNGVELSRWGQLGNDSGEFDYPLSIATDETGRVYVSDQLNNRVQIFDPNGNWLESYGERGGERGQFYRSSAIAIRQDNQAIAVHTYPQLQLFSLGPPTYTRPHANIVQATPASVIQGQQISLVGRGNDSDGSSEVVAYEWFIDGAATPFATTANASLSTAKLKPGEHTVTLRVRDGEGEYSEPESVSISVRGQTIAKRWLFLLYLDGDSGDGLDAYLNSATRYGALHRLINDPTHSPYVTIAALFDGGADGDSVRYLLRSGANKKVEKAIEESLGEINMGDPDTLVEFVRWAREQAPADYTYLALADHANALHGIAWDYHTGEEGLASDFLSNTDLQTALVQITNAGNRPIDVLHFDGCLMGLLESAYQVRGMARYLIASQNQAWSVFAYDAYRSKIGSRTAPVTLARYIATKYADLVAGSERPYTVAAYDLSLLSSIVSRHNTLSQQLQRYALASQEHRNTLLALRSEVQKFDSTGDIAITGDDDYVDLDHWSELMVNNLSDEPIMAAAQSLRTALQGFVIEQRSDSGVYKTIPVELEHARGVSIYLPNTPSEALYQTYLAGQYSDTSDEEVEGLARQNAAPFPQNDEENEDDPPTEDQPLVTSTFTYPQISFWDEFLAALLDNQPYDPTPSLPAPVAPWVDETAPPALPSEDLSSIALQIVPLTPQVGTATQLTLSMQLQGTTTPRENVSVAFYLGDPDAGGQLLGTTIIPQLVPNSPLTTPAVAWVPASAGETTLIAVIDPEDSISEPDEANNRSEQTVFVQAQAPPIERVATGLVARYDFNEGSGSIIRDSAGSGTPLDLIIAKPTAVRHTTNGLQIVGFTTIASQRPASNIIQATRASGEISLEAWITPAEADQFSARLISISASPNRRNISLIQGLVTENNATAAVARLRTSTTTSDGGVPLRYDEGLQAATLTHIVLTRRADGLMELYINGNLVGSQQTTGTLANWDDRYPLLLGGETTGRRWRGTYHLVAIYSRALQAAEVRQNFQAGLGTR